MDAHPSAGASPTRRQFGRFLAIGPVGVLLGALQYELLWRVNPLTDHRAGSTWLLSSLIGVAWAHALHCRFTFRGARSARWRDTIVRAYGIYSASIAIGTGLMWLLVDEFGIARGLAWPMTTALTSLLNFALLRRLIAGADAATDRWIPFSDVDIAFESDCSRLPHHRTVTDARMSAVAGHDDILALAALQPPRDPTVPCR